MNKTTLLTSLLTMAVLSTGIILSSCSRQDFAETNDFEEQVESYVRQFPYQDTHTYAMRYTQGDPAKFNTWVFGLEPVLVKAGEDKVVRMNNDTFYKLAFVVLENGPVVLGASAPSADRFNSFQLMDDRNVNYRNVIYPKGQYTLYHGERPEEVQGEAIEAHAVVLCHQTNDQGTSHS